MLRDSAAEDRGYLPPAVSPKIASERSLPLDAPPPKSQPLIEMREQGGGRRLEAFLARPVHFGGPKAKAHPVDRAGGPLLHRYGTGRIGMGGDPGRGNILQP